MACRARRADGVETAADVATCGPDRASNEGIWVKAEPSDPGIECWLRDAGMRVSLPDRAGERDLDFPDWRARYQRLLDGAGTLLIERLMTISGPVCLLCTEKRVAECHRWQIAEYAMLTRQLGASRSEQLRE